METRNVEKHKTTKINNLTGIRLSCREYNNRGIGDPLALVVYRPNPNQPLFCGFKSSAGAAFDGAFVSTLACLAG